MESKLLDRLASLKLTVWLLIALLGALTVGTIVESRQSTETALRLVYMAWWFHALLLAFGVNVVAALIQRFPTNRFRVGFLITHLALVIILVGSFLTWDLGVQGDLALWEGEQSNTFVERTSAGAQHRLLPFTVRLDDFQIDTYQGTRRPSMFRSLITVTDPEVGAPFGAVIEMNKPFVHRGISFFQSSYQLAGGREMSVFSVSQDPGQPVVYIGFVLLLVGMVTVLATRAAQARALSRRQEQRARSAATPPPEPAAGGAGAEAGKGRRRRAARAALATAAVLLAPALHAGAAGAATLPDPATVERLRALPIQHDGRVMPLDTVARETVWRVTGARGGWRGADSTALALGWALYPSEWASQPMVKVGSPDLAALAGLAPGTRHASFRDLLRPEPMRQLLAEARELKGRDQPLTPLQADALALEARLTWMQSFLGREALRAVPVTGDPGAQWGGPPPHLGGAPELLGWLAAQGAAEAAPAAAMRREITYNRVRPARLAWWILLPATVAAIAGFRRHRRWLDVIAVGGLLAGFAVMTWGLAIRWQVAGRIPASNMYESMLFLGWGVGLFALLAAAVLRNRLVILNATAMAALAMALTDLLPVDRFIHPMPPVLSGTPWLAIHVPIIMVGYAVLALGMLIAHMQVGVEIFAPARRELSARLNDLLYWYMHVGSILLVAGIIAGSVWAASSWGRYWGWDPKEVWSLIAFLAYMAILHGRFDRLIGPFGVAAASIVAFWTVLMTYIGVNYILAAGLHSYGFGGGAVARWMAGVALAEMVFLLVGWAAYRRNTAGEAPAALAVP